MAISETHLRDDKPSDIQPPRGYDMWTTERSGKVISHKNSVKLISR